MSSATNLEFALTGLLNQKPQSGYDLRKTFATTAMRHYSDSPGSIYPALRRLEARGWIAPASAAAPNPENRRGRQVFRLIPAGETALKEWLSRPLTKDDVVLRTPELMLRFAFMDGCVPRSTVLRFLDDFGQALASYVAELRSQLQQMSSKFPLHTGVLAFQLGIEQMEVQINWARQSRSRLSEDAP
jgi:DNA-binding PadR family transcriptional regulator